jgi:flagellar basal-body rod modification protein FlgD
MTIISASDPSAPASSSQAINASASLGQNDFLKLLVAQLKYQDPMKPTDSSQFMGEMAQFSTVQGVTSMGTTMEGMSHANDVSQAIALIGKEIRYKAIDGTIGSGTVMSTETTGNGAVTLQLAAGDVVLKDVVGVGPGA